MWHASLRHHRAFRTHHRRSVASQHVAEAIGPATCWDVPKLLRYIKIACDVLRCIFLCVVICAPDFRVAQPFIIRFLNSFQHCDENLINSAVICEAKSSVESF